MIYFLRLFNCSLLFSQCFEHNRSPPRVSPLAIGPSRSCFPTLVQQIHVGYQILLKLTDTKNAELSSLLEAVKLKGKYRFPEGLLFSVQSCFRNPSCHAMALFHLPQQVAQGFCGRQGDVTAQGRINSIHIKRKAFNKESSASSLPGGGKQISITTQIYF